MHLDAAGTLMFDVVYRRWSGEMLAAVDLPLDLLPDVGGSTEVLGRVTEGPAAGRIVAVRQGNLLATSFHPELTGDLRVHRFFVTMAAERASASTRG